MELTLLNPLFLLFPLIFGLLCAALLHKLGTGFTLFRREGLSAFAGGMVAATAAYGIAIIGEPAIRALIFSSPEIAAMAKAFLWVAPREEGLKLLALAVTLPAADEPMKWPFHGMAMGIGFASLENCLYLAQAPEGVGFFSPLLLQRWALPVAGHLLLGVLLGCAMGEFFQRLKQLPQTAAWGRLFGHFIVIVWLHGLFDFITFLFTPDQGVPLLITLTALMGAMAWRRAIEGVPANRAESPSGI